MNLNDYSLVQNLTEAYLDVYEQEEVLDEANKLEIHKNASLRQRVGRRQARDFDDVLHPSDYDTQGEPVRQKTHKDSRGVKKEEVDIYDTILSHLLDEGYCNTVEAAEVLMVNMSEEWRDSIVEASPSNPTLYKGTHGQTPSKYQDGRSDAGKRISGNSKYGPGSYNTRHITTDAPTAPGARPVNTPPIGEDERKYNTFVKNSRRRIPSPLPESVDIYDIILSHLLDEGYCNTVEAAEVLMVNMSEEWRDSIVEETLDERRNVTDRPLGIMHRFGRGVRTPKGEKTELMGSDREGNPTGKYLRMKHEKKAKQRRRDRDAMGRGTWDKE